MISEVAAGLVDRDGWEQLTMTELARKLGVQGPSLYNHVDNIDAVLADVQVEALTELAGRLVGAAVGKTQGEAITAFASIHYEFAAEHPGLYDLATREGIDSARMSVAGAPAGQALRAVIQSFGIPDPTLNMQLICMALLHGAIDLVRSGLLNAPSIDPLALYKEATELVVLYLRTEGGRAGEVSA